METTIDYVTHDEFQKEVRSIRDDIKDLEYHIDHKLELQESRLSEKLINRINDTYWKLIPIIIGLMTVVNGVFFLAYKMN